MSAKDIRLQYSGFVIFSAKIASVATGLIFQFIVARALLNFKTEYDLWFNINDLIGYFILLAGIMPFWTMRYATRDKEGAVKTGIFANLTISSIAALTYLLLTPIIMNALHIDATYLSTYYLVSIQIVEVYSINVLEACLQAKVPQIVGLGLMIQQVVRVILAYVLILQLGYLLLGAVIATVAAFALQISYYLKVLSHELKTKVRFEYIRDWLKGSLANLYNVVGNQIALYIYIMLFAYGGGGARGILGAAATVVNVITYSSFLSYALYPRLLAEKKTADITSSFKMVLMFAIPLTAGALAIPDSYIALLRPDIVGSAPVLAVLALDAFVIVVSGIYNAILLGYETVDEGARFSLRQLAKSRLFVAFSLPYIHSLITLPSAFYILTNYAQNQPFQAALYVSIINSIARFAMFFVLVLIVRKITTVKIPWQSVANYFLAASVMWAMLLLLPHPTRISLTLIETAIGGLIYLVVLMTIDKEARGLPRYIIQELRR